MKEKDEIRAVWRRVGIEVSDDEVDDEQVPTTAAAVGASQQRPSWIWFTGNICENIQDPVTYTGEYFFEAFLGSIVLIEYQHCGWMGKIKSTVMSLLIRYTHIPFYFHFSFTFPTSLIHHYAPLLRCDHTRSHSCLHNNHTCFIGPISLIWWTYDLRFTCIYFYS